MLRVVEESFELTRWVDMSSFGWHSGDHHVHAAGCSHYESPDEGVDPEHMWRQGGWGGPRCDLCPQLGAELVSPEAVL